MFYIAYKAKTIDILKCARCRSYSLNLKPAETASSYLYTCLDCNSRGEMQWSGRLTMEGFDSWEKMQDRIDELKAAMGIAEL